MSFLFRLVAVHLPRLSLQTADPKHARPIHRSSITKTIITRIVAAFALSIMAMPGVAAVIGFDTLSGNPEYWEESGFLFTPAGNSMSSLCYDDRCLQENMQGNVTTMTHDSTVGVGGPPHGDGGQGGNSTPLSDVAPHYTDPFNLDFFYFLLTGNGGNPNNPNNQLNEFTLTGTKTGTNPTTISRTFTIDDALTISTNGAMVSYASDYDGNNNNSDNGIIQKNVGY